MMQREVAFALRMRTMAKEHRRNFVAEFPWARATPTHAADIKAGFGGFAAARRALARARESRAWAQDYELEGAAATVALGA